MSLVKILEEIHIIEEKTLVLNEDKNKEGLNFCIYVDERVPGSTKHDSRFKTARLPNQLRNDAYSVNLDTKEIMTTSRKNKDDKQVKLIIQFMSRKAVNEALFNAVYNSKDSHMTCDLFLDSIEILLRTWKRNNPDDYDSDFAVFSSVVSNYNPMSVDEIKKKYRHG